MSTRASEIVDRQIRTWRLQQNARVREAQANAVTALSNVVAVSSTFGAMGPDVARIVAHSLDVPLYDREVLEHIAKTARIHVETVETLDERAQGALDNYLTALFRENNFDQSDYFRLLTRTVAALWSHGPCVFVGRGSPFIIDRRWALAVRFDAPLALRVERVAKLEHLSPQEARRRVHRVDAERTAFLKHFFDRDGSDPLGYDLVVNTAELDVERAAAIVLAAFRARFHGQGPDSDLEE